MIPREVPELSFAGVRTWSARPGDGPVPRDLGSGLVREKIGEMTGESPTAIVISRSGPGKPRVEGVGDVRFSLAHTDDLVVFAVAVGIEIGIDVERLDRQIDPRVIARCTTDEEKRILAGLGDGEARRRFLRFWVVKEAVAKVDGSGLRAQMGDIETTGEGFPGLTIRVAIIEGTHVAALAIQRNASG